MIKQKGVGSIKSWKNEKRRLGCHWKSKSEESKAGWKHLIAAARLKRSRVLLSLRAESSTSVRVQIQWHVATAPSLRGTGGPGSDGYDGSANFRVFGFINMGSRPPSFLFLESSYTPFLISFFQNLSRPVGRERERERETNTALERIFFFYQKKDFPQP